MPLSLSSTYLLLSAQSSTRAQRRSPLQLRADRRSCPTFRPNRLLDIAPRLRCISPHMNPPLDWHYPQKLATVRRGRQVAPGLSPLCRSRRVSAALAVGPAQLSASPRGSSYD